MTLPGHDDATVIEIRGLGGAPRRVSLEGPIELGREHTDLTVDDPKVSRRHLSLEPRAGSVEARDLGSSNGTWLGRTRLSDPVLLGPGESVRIGDTEIVVLQVAAPRASRADTPLTAEVIEVPDAAGPAATPRAGLDDLEVLASAAVVVRYRPGTAGERNARGVAAAAGRARRRLAGFGSEAWGAKPQVCLIDPYVDRDGTVVATGTTVDPDGGEIWMVVSAESPPEPLERPLTLLFGAAFPAADELRPLLEGYGLHLEGRPAPDEHLRGRDLPPLGAATGEEAAAMALSFARFLLAKAGDDALRRFLAAARPGRTDEAARAELGAPLPALEQAWREQLSGAAPAARPVEFLRLAAAYIRPHARREAEMFVYMLLSLAFTMTLPFVTRRLIDTAIPSGDFSEVLSVLGVLGVAFAVSLLAGLRRSFLAAYVSAAVVRTLRTQMFGRLQRLSAGWFHTHDQGDVLARCYSDVAQLEAGISNVLRDGLFQLLSLVVASVVLLRLEWRLALVVLVGAPLVFVVYRQMAAGARSRSRAVQEQTAALIGVSAENYSALSVVRAFGLERREARRFGDSSERLFRSQLRLQLFGGLFGLSVSAIVTGLRLVVLGFGAWLVLHDRLSLGGLVAFLGLMGEVIGPVAGLTELGQLLQVATGSLERVDDVLRAEPAVADPPQPTPFGPLRHDIRFAGVAFAYTPERRVLEGIDCVIPAGSRVAFVGPSGAGKSSLLQLLARFYDPDEGMITIDGRDLRDGSQGSWRDQLGIVFQESFLFDTTIRENIRLGRLDASDDEIEAAARAAELDAFVATLPNGYDTPVGERGGMLSGGQRQRLAIARALVRDPSVLVLDEATSALDPHTERLIAATLEQAGQGRTTVAVTHRLMSIAGYDRILVVADGRLVEQGSHDELLARGGVYAGLWAEQTGGLVPVEPPFDAAGALARLPLFADLDGPARADVVARLVAVDLPAGESLAEGGGRLAILRGGRAEVVAAGLGGESEVVAELGPGDAFGLAALLGAPSGAALRAVDAVRLLVLDDEAFTAIAARHPAVAEALAPRPPAVAPAGGLRLSRVTFGPARRDEVVAAVPADPRRTTGFFRPA